MGRKVPNQTKTNKEWAPNYLLDLETPIIKETANYNLRNADDIQTFQARTNLYYNSIFKSTIREWISLCDDTKQSPSISSFKSN